MRLLLALCTFVVTLAKNLAAAYRGIFEDRIIFNRAVQFAALAIIATGIHGYYLGKRDFDSLSGIALGCAALTIAHSAARHTDASGEMDRTFRKKLRGRTTSYHRKTHVVSFVGVLAFGIPLILLADSNMHQMFLLTHAWCSTLLFILWSAVLEYETDSKENSLRSSVKLGLSHYGRVVLRQAALLSPALFLWHVFGFPFR